MTISDELKPCPFCGARSVTAKEGSTFRWILAMCDCCGACGPETRRDTLAPADAVEDKRRALAEWNSRTAAAPNPRK